MEYEKLKFSVENASLVKEDPDSLFSLLSLDFFASGKNLHEMYVEESTLLRTADTIKNCPVVWEYNSIFNDAGTHSPDEIACGFIPESSEITSRKLEDGRTMLSVVSYVWKKFSGKVLDFFKRDGDKPISVEMSVYDKHMRPDGLIELDDYKFEAVTILGSLVSPAVPLAHATVLQFSKDYEEAYRKEFSKEYDSVDLTIPESIKESAQRGLDLYKKYNRGGNAINLSIARFILKNPKATPEKVRQIHKNFKNKKFNELNNKESNDFISWNLLGGKEGMEWSEQLSSALDEIDSKQLSYFGERVTMPYKDMKDVNPSLKGITPPISLEQANAIAAQADAIGGDYGWPTAIKSFKEHHVVKDGHWVKKEKMSEDEVDFALPKEEWGTGETIEVDKSKDSLSESSWGSVNKTELMHKVLKAKNYKSLVKDIYARVDEGWEEHPSSSLHYPIMQITGNKAVYNRYGLSQALLRAEAQKESGVISKVHGIYDKMGLEKPESKKEAMKEKMANEDQETPEEEKQETPEEEKKEKEKGEEKKMSLDAYLDVKAMLAMLENETESYKEVAAEFEKSPEEMNYGKMMGAMYAKMCDMKAMSEKMSEDMEKMAEQNKAYMAENEELKKFKADVEMNQFRMAVESTIKEIEMNENVKMPKEEYDQIREDAKNFSLETIDAWKNAAKAKAFTFSSTKKVDDGVLRMANPWGIKENTVKNVWEKLIK